MVSLNVYKFKEEMKVLVWEMLNKISMKVIQRRRKHSNGMIHSGLIYITQTLKSLERLKVKASQKN